MLTLLAIARPDNLVSKCSLKNSLNFRMDSLSAETGPSFRKLASVVCPAPSIAVAHPFRVIGMRGMRELVPYAMQELHKRLH